MPDRAYSTLEIKAVDEDKRIIEGIASTPVTDRVGDIVEPLGAEYTLPIPFLWQHDRFSPIGNVTALKVTETGITVRVQLESDDEPGPLKDLLDMAWRSIKKRLVRGLSIGFKPIEMTDIAGTWGQRFTKWDFLELSAVTIPANADASITSIKSADAQILRAASGKAKPISSTKSPGVSGSVRITKPEDQTMAKKTYAEQIADLQATRKQKADRLSEMTEKTLDEGRTKDATEREEFDTLKGEVDAIDREIQDLRDLEKQAARTATPVDNEAIDKATRPATSESRGFIRVESAEKLDKGILFARHAMAVFAAKGNMMEAAAIAKAQYGVDSPVTKTFEAVRGKSIETIMKAAVAAGTTTDATWAGPLLAYNTYAGDFVEYLRPRTIIGQFGQNGVPALRSIPFNVHIKAQTSGGQGYWVGQGAAKPVTSFDFVDAYHGWFKVAGIAVLTEELIRFSDPSAERLVRDSLGDALIEVMDVSFIDPSFAGVPNVSPPSILNGSSNTAASSGNDADAIRADIARLWEFADDAFNAMDDAVYIMNPKTARAVSMLQNPLGQSEFPGINPRGGTLLGVPVIVSARVPLDTSGGLVALVNASDIWFSDDGQATIDASREASIQMLDNPTNNSTGSTTPTTVVSMFQTDSVALRAHRFANWSRRRASAVAYLTDVLWGSNST